jgi:peptide deformylase
MYAADGIGLAAVQIGVAKRVIVIDLDQKEGRKNPVAYINPRITWASEETAVFEEGCLSVPEIWDDVERPARIKCEYLDRDGKLQTLEADGLLATCLQHEMDHLGGILFIDHLSRLKRAMAIKKLTKAKKLKAAV